MAVFRIERTRDYTVMSNHHLRNANLSLKAKGLLKLKQAVVYKDSNTCFNVACKIGIVYGGSLFVTDNIFCREGIFLSLIHI